MKNRRLFCLNYIIHIFRKIKFLASLAYYLIIQKFLLLRHTMFRFIQLFMKLILQFCLFYIYFYLKVFYYQRVPLLNHRELKAAMKDVFKKRIFMMNNRYPCDNYGLQDCEKV
jgi:hypothetical protein